MLHRTIVHSLRLVTAFALAALAAACSEDGPTSENALGGLGADPRPILGAWYGEFGDRQAYVHLVDDGAVLRTFIIGHPGDSPKGATNGDHGWAEGDAIPVRIGSQTYLSFKITEDSGFVEEAKLRGYVLLRYKTGRGYVTLYGMDSELLAAAIKKGEIDGTIGSRGIYLTADEDALRAFVERKGGEDLFSEQVGYLERARDEELPRIVGNRLR